jgi:hypothetical protein
MRPTGTQLPNPTIDANYEWQNHIINTTRNIRLLFNKSKTLKIYNELIITESTMVELNKLFNQLNNFFKFF